MTAGDVFVLASSQGVSGKQLYTSRTEKDLCGTALPGGCPGLKGRYTIGNCQRPVFSLDVSQYMHKITNL